MKPIGNSPKSIRTAADIGTLVSGRRKSLSLTQAVLAEQAGVGRRFLIELEEGKPTAQIGKVLAVLSMLGISIAAIES